MLFLLFAAMYAMKLMRCGGDAQRAFRSMLAPAREWLIQLLKSALRYLEEG